MNLCICLKEVKMEQVQLLTKINALSHDIKSEVNDFIDFLMTKKKKDIKKET